MPELPEVQSVVDSVSPHVTSAVIRHVELLRSDIVSTGRFQRTTARSPATDLATLLTARRIVSVTRRAKRIVFQLDDDSHFFVHLGMTGALSLRSAAAKREPHTHLILTLERDGAMELHFSDPRRFGKIVYIPPGQPLHDDVGPEPLTLSAADLAVLLKDVRRPIKSALLDQRLIAGLGNIYVDESLFASGIHPLRKASTLVLEETRLLNRAIKTVLQRAIRHKGSTLRNYRDAQGNAGGFQHLHRIYDREGQPCANCKTPVIRIVLGGRSTCFCPTCQPQGKTKPRTSAASATARSSRRPRKSPAR